MGGGSVEEVRANDAKASLAGNKGSIGARGSLRTGWQIKRQRGSHRLLTKAGREDYTFAYHDRAELGRGALELLGKKTGLRPGDL